MTSISVRSRPEVESDTWRIQCPQCRRMVPRFEFVQHREWEYRLEMKKIKEVNENGRN